MDLSSTNEILLAVQLRSVHTLHGNGRFLTIPDGKRHLPVWSSTVRQGSQAYPAVPCREWTRL